MILDWFVTRGLDLGLIALSCVGAVLALLVLTRWSGLRSFSKMSSFDFSITVAYGSILAATVVAENPSLANGVTALAALFLIQFLISRWRRRSRRMEQLVDNVPLLLMKHGQVLSEHLDQARITEDDLRSHLRLAGITHRDQVAAVVIETTGELSVLRSDRSCEAWMVEHVRGCGQWPD